MQDLCDHSSVLACHRGHGLQGGNAALDYFRTHSPGGVAIFLFKLRFGSRTGSKYEGDKSVYIAKKQVSFCDVKLNNEGSICA